MAVSSVTYLLFLPVIAAVNYFLPRKARLFWLLAANLYFCFCFGTASVLLMLFTVLTTYTAGRLLEKKKRKWIFISAIAVNLAILFFYKYFNFVSENIFKFLSRLGVEQSREIRHSLALPIGISFYTFQAIGYVADVYRGKIRAEKSFLKYAVFISFFPHITSGPIARAGEFLPQLERQAKVTFNKITEGAYCILWGLFLKLVIANRIALYVDTVYGNFEYYHGWYAVIAILLYSLQIYSDFYGYTMIAAGSAKLMGLELSENFRMPYLSASIANFWRNWHISLTTWFRDYVYIPLGGSRKGTIRKYINKMTVFLLSGLWHGASFGFLIWGGLNGLYQVAEEILLPLRKKLYLVLHIKENSRLMNLLRGILVYILISLAWVFFRASGAREAISIIRSAFVLDNADIFATQAVFGCGVDLPNAVVLGISLCMLLVSDLLQKKEIMLHSCRLPEGQPARNADLIVSAIRIALSVLVIMLFGLYGPAFDASSFIYYQF